MSTEHGLAESLLASMSEALYLVDESRTIRYWNRAAEQLTGFTAEDVVGRRCRDGILNHVDEAGRSLCGTSCPLLGTMRDGQVREVLAFAHHRDGHRMPVAVKAAPLRDDTGVIRGAVEVFHDDSRCRELAGQAADAQRLAATDQVTGVRNRRMLERDLRRLGDEQARYARRFAVLFADIDRFKSVNDRYGHAAGDEVLRCVAATLDGCTRAGDVVGRWGGEEFLILAPVDDVAEARRLAERIRRMVAASWVEVDGERVAIKVSIGIALSRRLERVVETVARADQAMLSAKARGRNRSVVSPPTEPVTAASRVARVGVRPSRTTVEVTAAKRPGGLA